MTTLNTQWRKLGFAASLAALMIASACSQVLETKHAMTKDAGCSGALGSYHLPRTLIRIKVERIIGSDGIKQDQAIFNVNEVVRMDRDLFCLDFLDSPTAADNIRVLRSKAQTATNNSAKTKGRGPLDTGLLQAITNKSTDHSGVILQKIARTIFIGVSGAAGFVPAETGARSYLATREAGDKVLVELDIEFDPLDPEDVARVNEDLRLFGYCVTLGRYSYDTSRSPTAYCDAAMRVSQSDPTREPIMQKAMRTFPSKVSGILYRPKLRYPLSVYVNDDLDNDGNKSWRQVHQEHIGLESRSPVFSMGVERAFFADRRTAMVFTNGSLTHFCVSKGNSATEFLGFPIVVVRSFIALPTQILQVKVDEENANQQIHAAMANTVRLQNHLLQRQRDPDADLAEGTPETKDLRDDLATVLTPATPTDFSAPAESPGDLLRDLCGGTDD